MTVWQETTAAKVQPGDVIRGRVRELGDPPLTVTKVERSRDATYVYCGQPDPLVFASNAPLERRVPHAVSSPTVVQTADGPVELDEWLAIEDVRHEERVQQGGY